MLVKTLFVFSSFIAFANGASIKRKTKSDANIIQRTSKGTKSPGKGSKSEGSVSTTTATTTATTDGRNCPDGCFLAFPDGTYNLCRQSIVASDFEKFQNSNGDTLTVYLDIDKDGKIACEIGGVLTEQVSLFEYFGCLISGLTQSGDTVFATMPENCPFE